MPLHRRSRVLLGGYLLGAFAIGLALAPRTASADDAEARWEIAIGIQHAPTAYGGDTDGAPYPSLAVAAYFGEAWSARLLFARGTYTDQITVGRATFTTFDVGIRRSLSMAPIRPFFEVAPVVVNAQWAPPTGTQYLLLGGRAGLGLRFMASRRWAVDLTASYLLTGGATDYTIDDAPPREYDGLNTGLIGAEITLGL